MYKKNTNHSQMLPWEGNIYVYMNGLMRMDFHGLENDLFLVPWMTENTRLSKFSHRKLGRSATEIFPWRSPTSKDCSYSPCWWGNFLTVIGGWSWSWRFSWRIIPGRNVSV